MSIGQNKAIARRFIQAWNAGGADILDELAAPDIIVLYAHFPEAVRGIDSFKQILSQTFTYFPDLQIMAEEPIAEGTHVVMRWNYRGTHQQGDLFGVKPSGTPVHGSGVTVYCISAGKVVEERGVADTFGLMVQLGAAPAPKRGAG
mgnify:CR=1 FL=1